MANTEGSRTNQVETKGKKKEKGKRQRVSKASD